ncbi:winged helix-turn-helix domain-containing protein [Streptomyces sp. NPDC057199]|uniref:winged helix-turn-helix domain-containing protein n=1 Tax=Streptomyces sp. NPDC057199 TaxID=3346047 RepID=UPI00362894F4
MSGERSGETGGKEFSRVFEAMRDRIADGTYPLGASLPTQRELVLEFEVSRDTVQRVMKELQYGGWVTSRQGSGSRVSRVVTPKSAPSGTPSGTTPGWGVTLGPIVNKAFEQPEVTLDVFTLTSESLNMHIGMQNERIRTREIAPRSITLRMLLPSEDLNVPYPRAKGDPDDPRLRNRLNDLTRWHTSSVRSILRALEHDGLVPSVRVEIRYVQLTPTFKLYLLNGTDALHALYEPVERLIELEDGSEILAVDVLGFGVALTHDVRGEAGSYGASSVDKKQAWFDSVWNLLAR